MRGAMKLPVKNIIKQLYPKQVTERAMMISAPSKHENNENGAALAPMNNIGSVAAFDKPRLPPVLGPLVVLSLLEMASSGDGPDK